MKVLNTLNIDTALGAVSIVFVASFLRNIDIELVVYLELFMSVLFIYNLDHLVDAYRLKAGKSSIRHSFYKNHFKALIIWQVTLFCLAVWLLFKLPPQVVIAGFIMAFFMALYFLSIFKINAKNFLLREVVVALGYTLAIIIIPFAHIRMAPDIVFYGFVIIVFLLALTNLLVISIYDIEIDKVQNHHSIARRISIKKLTRLTKYLIYTSVILLVVYSIGTNFMLAASFIIVNLAYLLLLHNQSYFKNNDLYRSIGELVLILPGLALFLKDAI